MQSIRWKPKENRPFASISNYFFWKLMEKISYKHLHLKDKSTPAELRQQRSQAQHHRCKRIPIYKTVFSNILLTAVTQTLNLWCFRRWEVCCGVVFSSSHCFIHNHSFPFLQHSNGVPLPTPLTPDLWTQHRPHFLFHVQETSAPLSQRLWQFSQEVV